MGSQRRSGNGYGSLENSDDLLNSSMRSAKSIGAGGAPPANELNSSMRSAKSMGGGPANEQLNSSFRSRKSAGGESDDFLSSSMRSAKGATPPAVTGVSRTNSMRNTPAASAAGSRPATPKGAGDSDDLLKSSTHSIANSKPVSRANSVRAAPAAASPVNSRPGTPRGVGGDSDDLLKSSHSILDKPSVSRMNSTRMTPEASALSAAGSRPATPKGRGGDSDDLLKSSAHSIASANGMSRANSIKNMPTTSAAAPPPAATSGANSGFASPRDQPGSATRSRPASAANSRPASVSYSRPASANGSRPTTPHLPFSMTVPTDVRGKANGGPPAGWLPGADKASQGDHEDHGAQPDFYDDDFDAMQAKLGYHDQKTGLEVPGPLQLFLQYDQDGGGIVPWEFRQMLEDLDGLAGTDEKVVDKYVQEEFNKADQSNDGCLNIDEFYMYYYSTLCFKFPVLRSGVNPGADLFNIFVKYASRGENARSEAMGCHQFAHMIRVCKLIDGKRITKASVDIIYWRARAADEMLEDYQSRPGVYSTAKMFYPQFLFALGLLGKKRRTGFQDIVSTVLAAVSVIPESTLSDFVMLLNQGGPDEEASHLLRPRGLPPAPRIVNDNTARIQQEAELVASLRKGVRPSRASQMELIPAGDPRNPHHHDHRSMLTTLERKAWGFGEVDAASALGKTGNAALNDAEVMYKVRCMDPDTLMVALKRCFESYNKANGGTKKSSMEKTKWLNCLQDIGVISAATNTARAGMDTKTAEAIFARFVNANKRHINYIEFVEGLRFVSNELRVSLNEVMEKIVAFGGPQYGL